MIHHPDNEAQKIWVGELVALVERIVLESGTPAGFQASNWTMQWLATENNALGGKRPNEFLDEPEGRDLIKTLILRMQSGAYS